MILSISLSPALLSPELRCGHCKDNQNCSVTDGVCAACEPGWNGTRCDQPCSFGYYGDGCEKTCPRCRTNESCDPKTGTCSRCDPGWAGPRCVYMSSNMMICCFSLTYIDNVNSISLFRAVTLWNKQINNIMVGSENSIFAQLFSILLAKWLIDNENSN